MTEQNTTSAPRDRLLALDEARYLLSGGKPLSLNPAKDFGVAEARDFIIDLFEQIAGRKLTPGQRELAVTTGLQLVDGDAFNIGSLVNAWMTEPDLRDFAARLLYAAMPEPHDATRSIDGLSIDRSGPTAVITLHGKPL
jgi:hypothetical protein